MLVKYHQFCCTSFRFHEKIVKLTEIVLQIAQFSVNLTKFSVKLKVKVICKTFAAPRECNTFADHFDFQFDGNFRQIDEKFRQIDEKLLFEKTFPSI